VQLLNLGFSFEVHFVLIHAVAQVSDKFSHKRVPKIDQAEICTLVFKAIDDDLVSHFDLTATAEFVTCCLTLVIMHFTQLDAVAHMSVFDFESY
jgi:hypothetical protein